MCAAPCEPSAVHCGTCGSSLHPLGVTLPQGTVIHGRYQIEDVLGQGGFGITYLAHELPAKKKKKKVALKELFPIGATRQGERVVRPPDLSEQDWRDAKQSFTDESTLLSTLKHPGIMRVFEVFEERGTAYMVMEHLRGESLQQLLDEKGRLPPAQVSRIAKALTDALEVVHRAGHLHRDLKPGNIFLAAGKRVVLIDFGSARSFILGKTVSHTRLLTPGYAPLEQYGNEARYGPYTDIYALGATLHHALTGTMPPPATDLILGQPLPPLPPKTPPALARAIQLSMSLKVQDRPQNVQELRSVLKGSGLPRPQPAPPTPAPPQPTPYPVPQTPGKPPRKRTFPPIPTRRPRHPPSPGPGSNVPAFLKYGGWVGAALGILVIWGVVRYISSDSSSEASTKGASTEAAANDPNDPRRMTPPLPPAQALYEEDVYVLTTALRPAAEASTPSPNAAVAPSNEEQAWQAGTLVRAGARKGKRVQVSNEQGSGWVDEKDLMPVLAKGELTRLQQELTSGTQDTVHLKAGAYVINAENTTNDLLVLNQTLEGEGASQSWLVLQASTRQLSLKGDASQAGLKNLTVVKTNDMVAVNAINGEVKLHSVSVLGSRRGVGSIGLMTGGTAKVEVQESSFQFHAYGVWVTQQSHLNLAGASLTGNDWGGLVVRDDGHANLKNTFINANGGCGLIISKQGTTGVANSTFNDNRASGVCVQEQGDLSVQSSEVLSNGAGGLHLTDQGQVSFQGGRISGNGRRGVSIMGNATLNLNDVTLTENKQSAVVLEGASQGYLKGNTVTTNGGAGLTVADKASIQAEQNQFTSNSGPAVQLRGAVTGALKLNTCQDNTPNAILDARQQGIHQSNLNLNNAGCAIQTK